MTLFKAKGATRSRIHEVPDTFACSGTLYRSKGTKPLETDGAPSRDWVPWIESGQRILLARAMPPESGLMIALQMDMSVQSHLAFDSGGLAEYLRTDYAAGQVILGR